jgi:hypothetical protein
MGQNKVIAYTLMLAIAATMIATFFTLQGPEQPWGDTGFRVPVERVPDDEAAAYYDGRKLVNDNQRNYVDKLAEEGQK